MQTKLLDVLACPQCGGALSCTASETDSEGEVLTGQLACAGSHQFQIENGIPRFVPRDNYAASFGYQWNRFKLEQIDSANGTNLSAARFYAETSWSKEWLKGKWILDAGCGAGRFLDVCSDSEAEVVGLDISSAIDASKANLKDRKNVHFVQASIYEPPFRAGAFDACYCIGVIQHTPDPAAALRSLPGLLKQGGQIAVTVYERKPWTKLYSKYLVRPLTKRVNEKTLLLAIRGLMPIFFPLTEVGFRLPLAGRLIQFAIPVANYVHQPALNMRQRYQWAVLDTFDMLSPRYDQPQTEQEAREALASANVIELQRLPNPGLNIIGLKA